LAAFLNFYLTPGSRWEQRAGYKVADEVTLNLCFLIFVVPTPGRFFDAAESAKGLFFIVLLQQNPLEHRPERAPPHL
jgi:hypothetical protein